MAQCLACEAPGHPELLIADELDLGGGPHVLVRDEKLADPASVLALLEAGQELRAHQLVGGLAGIFLRLVARPGNGAARAIAALSDFHDAVAARAPPKALDGSR